MFVRVTKLEKVNQAKPVVKVHVQEYTDMPDPEENMSLLEDSNLPSKYNTYFFHKLNQGQLDRCY